MSQPPPPETPAQLVEQADAGTGRGVELSAPAHLMGVLFAVHGVAFATLCEAQDLLIERIRQRRAAIYEARRMGQAAAGGANPFDRDGDPLRFAAFAQGRLDAAPAPVAPE